MSEPEPQAAAGIDVAIPCYQYGRYLRECVASVLSQGIRNVRVLIIDNASTDGSVEVAQQLAAEDRRVDVVAHRSNLGQHASFNEAIDWAISKYFMVLCADDLLAPGCLARAVGVMERHAEVGFAYGRAVRLRPEDAMPVLDLDPAATPWRVVASADLLERLCGTAVNHIGNPSAVVVRTTTQKLAGHYRPQLPHTDDLEMWLRLAGLGAAAETNAPLAILRAHATCRGAVARRNHDCDGVPFDQWHEEAAFDSFFAHEGGSLPEARRLQRLARRSLGEHAYWMALAHLCRGQAGGRELFKFALRRRPANIILPPVSYLLRRQDLADRIVHLAREMVRSWRIPATPARADG